MNRTARPHSYVQALALALTGAATLAVVAIGGAAPAAPTSPAAAATAAASVIPASYVTQGPSPAPVPLSDRDWLLIARNPWPSMAKHVIVYGKVTQFDTATGLDTFRADVGGVKQAVKYGFVSYPTNTMLRGETPELLGNLVQGDLFRAEAVVTTPYTYTTAMGAETTVPNLIVTAIKVTGHI